MKTVLLVGLLLALGTLALAPAAQADCGPLEVGCCAQEYPKVAQRERLDCTKCVGIGNDWSDTDGCVIY